MSFMAGEGIVKSPGRHWLLLQIICASDRQQGEIQYENLFLYVYMRDTNAAYAHR